MVKVKRIKSDNPNIKHICMPVRKPTFNEWARHLYDQITKARFGHGTN